MRATKVKLNENFKSVKIAHRGLHSSTVSENSMQAFGLAIEKGYAIELDIHLLTDGKLAVVHDSNLKRVTGKEVIVETLSSADLKDYPLLLNGETIPLLEDVFALVNGRVPILIELKFDRKFDHRQADALLALLETYPRKDTIALQSFTPFCVKYLKEHTSVYPVGLLSAAEPWYKLYSKVQTYLCKTLKMYKFIHADFISYCVQTIPDYVEKLHAKGEPLFVWTIRSTEDLQKAKLIADGIIFEHIDPDMA